ncbi:APC family permease [Alkalibacter rhizosphaerae]|uniref:APC family permease n=1 Tax=Alkalibacter rhizosphaerae TaxID=2815577 RepID=A0A975AHV3_9FIRM|nr:APC family permease [Alkalibacter rhizosphaerae]QSX09004.1 APC family permease [Alkalibacter rhizosphaerae]
MDTLEKKYGLFTATAMVVGVVIGSGVFFKADDVLSMTDGNLILALIAWGIGAFSMIFGSLVFAEFAQRIERSNGIIDYTEEAYGPKAGYMVGWFNWILYFSPLAAILSWVSAMYTGILFGVQNPENAGITWLLAAGYMLLAYVLNALAPKLAGNLQVGTTVVKLVPLALIGVVGTIYGMKEGITMDNILVATQTLSRSRGTLASAVVSTAFAYEGWIIAVTINSEIKDARKNLPKALTLGAFIVFITYIAYFFGIAGVMPTEQIVSQGDQAVSLASNTLFGPLAATILLGFVVVSCLGTLNGLVLSTIRLPYSMAVRNQGPVPRYLSRIHPTIRMPLPAALLAGCISFGYLLLWHASLNGALGRFVALDEIPIVMVYGLYVFLYIWYMKRFRDLGWFKRFVIPTFALMGAMVILYGGASNPSIGMNLLISILVLVAGLLFYRKQ